ncbi:MAG: HD domain-containing protein [Eudoraea sp.]|uniref:HD domain-containing protein n=1 Tax=Eudoraea sp. TaxID=1979955 RepID=UPI003C734BD9
MILRNKDEYPKVCFEILSELEKNLSSELTYHSIEHTVDVANVCDDYIEYYNIPKEDADLIRIAAVGHDMGYLDSPNNHEEKSILKINSFLEPLISKEKIEIINGLIRATKIPQQPKTFYEEILADSDLDYLGRTDYPIVSRELYQEFLHFQLVSNEKEWLKRQIKFLKNHRYHTSWAKLNREEHKAKNLKELEMKLKEISN